tara:strand:- start:5667 stop:5948 length:282 start_codon:yes stop_codon:yes gene_type:complete
MIEVPASKIKPRNPLGYELGINRNEPYKERRPDRNVFQQGRGGTRMAGDINIFNVSSGSLSTKNLKGKDLGLYRSRALRSAPLNIDTEQEIEQ